MATFRVNKSKNYTTINNIGLRDERLSWKAKGILSYILSLPDDWVFYMEEISTHAKDGIDSLRVGMKELKKFGYVRRFPVKNEKGKITSWETIIYEVPQVENPHMENPQVEKPQMEVPFMENPTLLSTKELSTKELSTKELSTKELSTNIPNTDKQNNTMSSSNEEDNQSSIPYQEIIDYLNEKAKKNFNHKAEAHRKLIRARWNEGYTIEKFKTVIDNKVSQWLGQFDRDNKPLDRYLRPSTLFAQIHFDNYLNETVKGAKNNDPVARNGAVYYNETEFDF